MKQFAKKISTLHSALSTPLGFTLTELLIVIAIIALLSTFSVVNFLTGRERARDAQRKSDLRQMQAAFEFYRSDQGAYPPSLPACGSPLEFSGSTYMKKIPCDPVGNGQAYTYVNTGTDYQLIACLENEKDNQKDTANNDAYCSGGTTNWSYTLTNP
jgi:prepilin-type N-terminal cleavage/methylation domain-containing protein